MKFVIAYMILQPKFSGFTSSSALNPMMNQTHYNKDTPVPKYNLKMKMYRLEWSGILTDSDSSWMMKETFNFSRG